MKRSFILQQLAAKNVAHDATSSKTELLALLHQHGGVMNKITRAVNYAGGRGKIEVTYNAKVADEPVQVMVCEDIGKDAWTGEGFTLKDLREALNGVPTMRKLDFFTNSQGGYVSEGCSIRDWLKNWGGDITNTILGMAASAASWCIPANKVRAYKNSQIFTHRSMAAPFGNRDDLAEAITFLDKTDQQIAEMYADMTGESVAAMLDMMKGKNGQGTLLTGPEAFEMGLVDEIVDGESTNSFNPEWINSARQKLAALNMIRDPKITDALPAPGKQTNNKNKTIMNKEKMIALLNKWGVIPPENATDEQLLALVEAGPENKKPDTQPASNAQPALSAEDQQLLKDLKNQVIQNRQREIRNTLQHIASVEGGGRIPVNEIENWETQALAAKDGPEGNPILNSLKKLPAAAAPGVPALPQGLNKLEVTSADFKDIARGFQAHNEASKAFIAGNDSVTMKEISNSSIAKANFFRKFRNRFLEMVNTNTIDAGLQRQVILQDVVIRDFKRRVIGLDMFSTVFRNVPLQGTNVVEVPYYDLDSSASTPFVSGTGYTTVGNTTSAVRSITVGEGAANGDRLYQALAFSSQEIARQPYLKIAQLAGLKAEKLAFDIWQDILSVVTSANYGAPAINKAFDFVNSDDLADLKVACKTWPSAGRGLILDSAYDGNLMKDPTFKAAYQQAFDAVKTSGKLNPELYGFEYLENPNIPDNGENLRGFAFWKFAILVAFAPVPPVDEVRRSGTTWELITDPDTGISLEYRAFGDNVKDQATNVIESSYGFNPGLKTGLKRIVTP